MYSCADKSQLDSSSSALFSEFLTCIFSSLLDISIWMSHRHSSHKAFKTLTFGIFSASFVYMDICKYILFYKIISLLYVVFKVLQRNRWIYMSMSMSREKEKRGFYKKLVHLIVGACLVQYLQGSLADWRLKEASMLRLKAAWRQNSLFSEISVSFSYTSTENLQETCLLSVSNESYKFP